MRTFRVVIVGRPNVGKSTLFNRLIGRRRALVHNLPGVTRDRIEGKAEVFYQGIKYELAITDTGGMGGELFPKEIAQQVDAALTDADIVLFMMDGTQLTHLDQDLHIQMKKRGVFNRVPVVGVVNKIDVANHEGRIGEFYGMGLDPLVTVSAEHSRGVEALRDLMMSILLRDSPSQTPETKAVEPQSSLPPSDSLDQDEEVQGELSETKDDYVPKIPRISIVGRPNVGKSTLLNALLGEKRVITSPMAGTTVDSVDTIITRGEQTYCLVDTAGIRRKGKTDQGVEVLSVLQAMKSLEHTDLAILVLDGEEGISDQDEKIAGMIEEAGCSIVLLMNKWDTQRSNQKFTKELASERIRAKMRFLNHAPIVFASAVRNEGLQDIWELIAEILSQRTVKISTKEFTEWVRLESTVHNPHNAKFYLCHQSGRHPPTFVCHVSDPKRVDFSLKRHLVNALRARWGYMGSPVRMLFVEGSGKKLPRK